jgi:hypothetical protein
MKYALLIIPLRAMVRCRSHAFIPASLLPTWMLGWAGLQI